MLNRRFPSLHCLCFKASPSAKPFTWKLVLFTRKFHLFWNRGERQLGNRLLHSVLCYLYNLSRHIFVAHSVTRSRTQFYFLQQLSIVIAQCNTPVQRFAQWANQDPYYPLLSPPRSQFCELLAVPLHSVTPLFVQLQCYAFKRCETRCTKYCLA